MIEARTTSTNCSRITAADQFRKWDRPIVSCACPLMAATCSLRSQVLHQEKLFLFTDDWNEQRSCEWNEECFVGNKASFRSSKDISLEGLKEALALGCKSVIPLGTTSLVPIRFTPSVFSLRSNTSQYFHFPRSVKLNIVRRVRDARMTYTRARAGRFQILRDRPAQRRNTEQRKSKFLRRKYRVPFSVARAPFSHSRVLWWCVSDLPFGH